MSEIDFRGGLLPAIVRDVRTGAVLMLAWMNEESFARTLDEQQTWFWSRSRQELWHKGATSGNVQQVVNVRTDCDGDAILIDVVPQGPACHTGERSCFGDGDGLDLRRLFELLVRRKGELPEGSYTAGLFRDGVGRMNEKVMEEAEEVTVAATRETHQRLVEESADLIFHLTVLLVEKGVGLGEIAEELERRVGKRRSG
jgi:phosphoribosyl-AMP cyclohydrolase / phosphoribosyl-ATP pyrophosphohydrolase